MQVLDNICVLDFSSLLPGPLATLILAELGAEVIKVEKPDQGDDMRGFEPKYGADSINFALLNRGKKSIALNLKDKTAIERLRPLLERADILIEQFRPGVMDRLGLSYDAVRAIKPDIIYCSITGYGQTGPKRGDAGHDINYLAETGMLSLSHGNIADPVMPPALVADIAGGAYPAVMNILIALRARDQGQGGRHLDISMSDNLFPFLYWAMGSQITGDWPRNGENLVTGGSPRYRLYRTADDRLLAAAPLEDRFWTIFCDVIELEADFRDRAADPQTTAERVAAIIMGKDAAHWASLFDQADCCCCIVSTFEEALNKPHFQERGLFQHQVRGSDGGLFTGLPLPLDPSFQMSPDARPAPRLGGDNDSLIGE